MGTFPMQMDKASWKPKLDPRRLPHKSPNQPLPFCDILTELLKWRFLPKRTDPSLQGLLPTHQSSPQKAREAT